MRGPSQVRSPAERARMNHTCQKIAISRPGTPIVGFSGTAASTVGYSGLADGSVVSKEIFTNS